MKIHRTTRSTEVGQDDHGFTLIEILIAIVLIGILSAVAVVGISSLVSKGTSASCKATRDSASAASAVYFGVNSKYPATWAELTGGTPPALTLPSSVTAAGQVATAAGTPAPWTITMTAGTATTPTLFTDCP